MKPRQELDLDLDSNPPSTADEESETGGQKGKDGYTFPNSNPKDRTLPALPNVFRRTSAALKPFSIFRMSMASAASSESRNWGAKPKEDHEIEGLNKEEMAAMMEEDPMSKKANLATGTKILRPDQIPEDQDILKANRERLAYWAAKKNQAKARKKRMKILVVLLLLGALAAVGALIFMSSAKEDEVGEFRIDQDQMEDLCEAIKDSDRFDYSDDDIVFWSCDDDNRSTFKCDGSGNLEINENDCSNKFNQTGFCSCEYGQIVSDDELKESTEEICVEPGDDPYCPELEGDLQKLLDEYVKGEITN